MSKSDNDSGWPALDKLRKGYEKGEIVVISGGTGGRSLMTDLIARKLIDEGHQVEIAAEVDQADIVKRLEETHIPEYLTIPDTSAYPTGKRRKPKKRKLKRKPRP